MKILFIGGTGTISTAITKKLAEQGHELYLINRGVRNVALPDGVRRMTADINDEATVAGLIAGMKFDVVADFIAFAPEQVERDYRLFAGKTQQFVFISSASAYQKPLSNYLITEGTLLSNPYWEYSRKKIACEEFLTKMYRENGFPITIVRPSHTYSERSVPLCLHGTKGNWQTLKRMLEGKPVIITGDGSSLWTLTHSSDFAEGFVGLLGNARAIGEAVHITSDEALTWNQIYTCIAGALGTTFKPCYVPAALLARSPKYNLGGYLFGDKANTVVFDNTKLKRLVPYFAAKTPFGVGVRSTLDYILSHEDCRPEDPEFDEWCDRVVAVMSRAGDEIAGI